MSKVISILMSVLFPAPFGPRHAKISPDVDAKGNIIHGGKILEPLRKISDLDYF